MPQRAPAAFRLFGLIALTGLAACAPGSATPTNAPSTAAGGPTASGVPDFSKPFTSTMGGYRLSVPADMDPKPATAPMPIGLDNWSSDDPFVDQFFGVGVGPLEIVSAPIAGGSSASTWIAARQAAIVLSGSAFPSVCQPKDSSSRIQVDGHDGLLDTTCAGALLIVLVPAGSRVYEVDLHADPPDRAWLAALLATMRVDPASAVPAPSPGPSPATSP